MSPKQCPLALFSPLRNVREQGWGLSPRGLVSTKGISQQNRAGSIVLTGSRGDMANGPWRSGLFLGEEMAPLPPALCAPAGPPGATLLLAGDCHTQVAGARPGMGLVV